MRCQRDISSNYAFSTEVHDESSPGPTEPGNNIILCCTIPGITSKDVPATNVTIHPANQILFPSYWKQEALCRQKARKVLRWRRCEVAKGWFHVVALPP